MGFALSSYPVGVERGFVSRAFAVERTLATLRFFHDSVQSADADATGYKGFYYHFLDMVERKARLELRAFDDRLGPPAGGHADRRGVFLRRRRR